MFLAPKSLARWKLLFIAAAVSIAFGQSAFAHDPGLSSAEVRAADGQIDVLLAWSDRDIAMLLGTPRIADDAAMAVLLETLARRAVHLEIDGSVEQANSTAARLEGNNVVFALHFAGFANARQITFRSELIKELPFGHRQAFVARDGAGAEIARHLLSAQENFAVVAVQPSAAHPTAAGHPFWDFLALGVRHIWSGYDHLLFLFALLLVCRDFRDAAVVISFFSLAHSITLALATFNLVQLSSRIVEPAIAASIVYVGVENLVRRGERIRGRGVLTFVFGLVHGLGFAAVLRELGVAAGPAAVMPLLSFNGGVEVGQLVVAGLAWPMISALRRRTIIWPRFGVPVCSAFVVIAGGYWLLDRTLLAGS